MENLIHDIRHVVMVTFRQCYFTIVKLVIQSPSTHNIARWHDAHMLLLFDQVSPILHGFALK